MLRGSYLYMCVFRYVFYFFYFISTIFVIILYVVALFVPIPLGRDSATNKWTSECPSPDRSWVTSFIKKKKHNADSAGHTWCRLTRRIADHHRLPGRRGAPAAACPALLLGPIPIVSSPCSPLSALPLPLVL